MACELRSPGCCGLSIAVAGQQTLQPNSAARCHSCGKPANVDLLNSLQLFVVETVGCFTSLGETINEASNNIN